MFFQEDGTPSPFRYQIKARAMITCFEPKPLHIDSESGATLLRASMFGAALLPAPLQGAALPDPGMVKDVGLSKLPMSEKCRVLWEVGNHGQPKLFRFGNRLPVYHQMTSQYSCDGFAS